MSMLDISQHFDHLASDYDQHYLSDTPGNIYSYEKQKRASLAITWAEEYFANQARAPERILDVGCGNGYFLRSVMEGFPDSAGLGLDVSKEMIANAERLSRESDDGKNIEFSQGQLTDVDSQFDLVVALGVIGYQRDQLEFARDIAERVAMGGMLVLSFGNQNSLLRRSLRGAQYLKRKRSNKQPAVSYASVTSRNLSREVESCGLQETRGSFIGYGVGLPVGRWEVRVSRFLERTLPRMIRVPQALAISGITAWIRTEER